MGGLVNVGMGNPRIEDCGYEYKDEKKCLMEIRMGMAYPPPLRPIASLIIRHLLTKTQILYNKYHQRFGVFICMYLNIKFSSNIFITYKLQRSFTWEGVRHINGCE